MAIGHSDKHLESALDQTSTGCTVVCDRRSQWYGRYRDLLLVIDNSRRIPVRDGQRVEVSVTPGEHVFRLQMDWCSSNSLFAECRQGERIQLVCGANAFPLALLSTFFSPSTVFRLSRSPARM